MKLPKCPHCEKMLLGMFPVFKHIGNTEPDVPTFFCPETGKKQDPDWVEVLEVQ